MRNRAHEFFHPTTIRAFVLTFVDGLVAAARLPPPGARSFVLTFVDSRQRSPECEAPPACALQSRGFPALLDEPADQGLELSGRILRLRGPVRTVEASRSCSGISSSRPGGVGLKPVTANQAIIAAQALHFLDLARLPFRFTGRPVIQVHPAPDRAGCFLAGQVSPMNAVPHTEAPSGPATQDPPRAFPPSPPHLPVLQGLPPG